MISLQEYILENKDKIKLPYTFDIYNEGAKNKDFSITKANIYHTYFKIDNLDSVDKHFGFIALPLAPKDINYKEVPTKENTDNWTKAPKISVYSYAGAFYSDKSSEYSKKSYDYDWETWLRSLKPYMSGKISVTLSTEDGELTIHVNDDKFNKESKEKIEELSNVENIKKFGEEITKKEQAEIEKKEAERKQKEKEQKEYSDFLNSMSEKERLEYLRQADYDRNYLRHYRGPGRYTGD